MHYFGHTRSLWLYHPEPIEEVLGNRSNLLEKTSDYRLLTPVLQDGLIVSSGQKWRQRRKVLTPAFHFKILETALDIINRKVSFGPNSFGHHSP